jgi:hypothetical protein
MDQRCGLNGRAPALKEQSLEFKLQFYKRNGGEFANIASMSNDDELSENLSFYIARH